MKKYRPFKAGFIVVYVLGALCALDAGNTLYSQIAGTENEYMANFSFFSYLLAVLAFFYVKMYASARIEIDDKTLRIVCPVYIRPAVGAKRASFIYRQGDTDLKLMDKRFNLADIESYGWIEDLGYNRLDKSGAKETNKLFPVHEIAFVTSDGKRYHMNGGFYSEKALGEMLVQIRAGSGKEPTGKLAKL